MRDRPAASPAETLSSAPRPRTTPVQGLVLNLVDADESSLVRSCLLDANILIPKSGIVPNELCHEIDAGLVVQHLDVNAS